MHGHEVEDGADARLVELVDEGHELLGRAVAAGRRKEARALVAPALVVGILRQGHELHVVVAGLGEVVDERLGNLLVAIPELGLVDGLLGLLAALLAPAAQVQLVDVERLADVRGALGQPLCVVPFEARQVTHDGAVLRTQLGAKGVGVRMVLIAATG